jgi:translation initiation factor eIF-2B subunit epsilon
MLYCCLPLGVDGLMRGASMETRSRGESSVFVLDKATSECLHYVPLLGHPPTSVVRIPRELFKNHSKISIRNDLIDCSIDICSPEVRLLSPFK